MRFLLALVFLSVASLGPSFPFSECLYGSVMQRATSAVSRRCLPFCGPCLVSPCHAARDFGCVPTLLVVLQALPCGSSNLYTLSSGRCRVLGGRADPHASVFSLFLLGKQVHWGRPRACEPPDAAGVSTAHMWCATCSLYFRRSQLAVLKKFYTFHRITAAKYVFCNSSTSTQVYALLA